MASASLLTRLLDRTVRRFPAVKPLYGLLAAGAVAALINLMSGLNRLTFISIFATIVAMILLFLFSKIETSNDKIIRILGYVMATIVAVAFVFVIIMSAWLSLSCSPKIFAYIYGVTDVCYPSQPMTGTSLSQPTDHVQEPDAKSTADAGPVVWDLGAQFLLVSNGGPLTQVGAIFFQGTSRRAMTLKRAFAVSGLTGHKQGFSALVPYKGDVPVDQVDIPPDTKFAIEIPFKPPLSVQDFLAQWGKVHISIVYDDGSTYEHDFDQTYIAEKLRRMSPDAFGPHITPRQ